MKLKEILILVAASALVVASQAQVPMEKEQLNRSSSRVPEIVPFNRAPEPVQKAIREHAGAGEVDLTKQIENGQIVYDASFLKEGLLTKLKVTENGTVLGRGEIRRTDHALPLVGTESLTIRELPALAQETFRKEVKDLSKLENLRRQWKDAQYLYHATVHTNGVPTEIVVAENGRLVSKSTAGKIEEASGATGGELRLKDLPETVQERVRERAGSNRIGKIRQVERGGNQFYEITFEEEVEQTKRLISADGKWIAP